MDNNRFVARPTHTKQNISKKKRENRICSLVFFFFYFFDKQIMAAQTAAIKYKLIIDASKEASTLLSGGIDIAGGIVSTQ